MMQSNSALFRKFLNQFILETEATSKVSRP